jgi:hypothetical protein
MCCTRSRKGLSLVMEFFWADFAFQRGTPPAHSARVSLEGIATSFKYKRVLVRSSWTRATEPMDYCPFCFCSHSSSSVSYESHDCRRKSITTDCQCHRYHLTSQTTTREFDARMEHLEVMKWLGLFLIAPGVMDGLMCSEDTVPRSFYPKLVYMAAATWLRSERQGINQPPLFERSIGRFRRSFTLR